MTQANLPFDIDVQSVKRMLDQQDDFLLLDVREADEHQTARIEGATLIPMSQMMQRAGELAPHRDRRVVVHCHHGGRSAQVANWLRGQGFSQVQNMEGGIDQWSVEVDPKVPRY